MANGAFGTRATRVEIRAYSLIVIRGEIMLADRLRTMVKKPVVQLSLNSSLRAQPHGSVRYSAFHI